MLIDYETLVALLEKSGLPDQGAPPSMGITIRFKERKPVDGSQRFTTPDGRLVALALNAEGELCAIGMTKRIG
jgi:hypothetical protein